MQKWWRDGIINHDMFVWKNEQQTESIRLGKIGSGGFGTWIMYPLADELSGHNLNHPLQEGQVKQDWVDLKELKMEGRTIFVNGYGPMPNRFLGITNSTKYAAEIVNYINWVAEDLIMH